MLCTRGGERWSDIGFNQLIRNTTKEEVQVLIFIFSKLAHDKNAKMFGKREVLLTSSRFKLVAVFMITLHYITKEKKKIPEKFIPNHLQVMYIQVKLPK